MAKRRSLQEDATSLKSQGHEILASSDNPGRRFNHSVITKTITTEYN